MHWVLLAGIVVVLIIASIRFPKIGLSVLGIAIAVGLFLFLRTEGEVEKTRMLIRPSQIQLDHIEFSPSYADSYNITGRIRNQSSEHTLTEVSLQVVMSDCVKSGEQDDNCEIVGEVTTRIIKHIPPGQARDFNDNIQFAQAKLRGQVAWEYTVVGSRAK